MLHKLCLTSKKIKKKEKESIASLCCRPAILFLAFVIDAAFALAIVGFLIMHCRMIIRNMTTIEMYEKRRNAAGAWPFDRGAKHNFLEVFGRRYAALVYDDVRLTDLCTINVTKSACMLTKSACMPA